MRPLADAIPRHLVVDAGDLTGVGAELELVDLSHDSRQIGPGWVFACVPGDRHDGHDFAPAAVDAGAAMLLVERRLPLAVPQLVVADVRRAMGHAAAELHGHPASRLTMVGITGTNGKTTTTRLVASILRAAGRSTREIGTLSGTRTTPEAPDLQRRLAGYVAEGADAVVMEVSSHALALHRVDGTRFDVAAFTNLSQDHLDLHGSMEAYFRAKAMLFTSELSDAGVTNLDDAHGRLLRDAADIDLVGYSRADADDLRVEVGSHRFRWRGVDVSVPLGGAFNVENSLCALSIADRLGIDATTAAAGLAAAGPIPGRFELVSAPDDPFAVLVDYAHTPDGLAEMLRSVRASIGPARVICVFGCGGDRDRDKRPKMAAAVAAHADRFVITSDNPRHEDPEAIIADAVAGVEPRYRDRLTIEVDRRRGIAAAFDLAGHGDVVVVAGRGHEPVQAIGDVEVPFDDRTVARELLVEHRNQTGAQP